LSGGMQAANSALMIKRKGEERFRSFQEVFGTVSAAKFVNLTIKQGDEVLLQSPGGGGFGDPVERPVRSVLRDVNEGFVSPEAAGTYYRTAVRLVSGQYVLDHEETARLRSEGR
ncbi:MAG: hypothetical protein IT330_04800, partial [Anaerolineae bacterium]|nr:hypothetical protein [Anaerolineae bacterium]